MESYEIFGAYCDQHFRRTEGEQGLRNLENMCEALGYGRGFMQGRALEEFFADNPGAIEAVLEFVGNWVDRNTEWQDSLAQQLED